MNLAELVDAQARERPNQTALIDGREGRERILSFKDLAMRIDACARALSDAGIGMDARVLVLVPMRAELYITLAALWKIGATALFLDPSAGGKHLTDCCARTRPDAVVGIPQARFLWWIKGALRQIPKKFSWGQQLHFNHSSAEPFPARQLPPKHPAILSFTSGSTGAPKGAIRSHGLLLAQYKALLTAIELKSGETELATMPIIALVNLAAGITTLIPDADLKRPGFVKVAPILKQIQRFRPDRCVASPSFLQRFPQGTGSLKKIYTGGAPVFPRGLRHIQKAFPFAAVHVLYGSTEAEPISHILWDAAAEAAAEQTAAGQGLLVGPIAPEASVRILRDHWGQPLQPESIEAWKALECPSGTSGEIVVAGEHVIPGYLDGIGDAENKIHADGRVWHRTGDAGYFDVKGQLWLMGRCAAKFKHLGQWIYPFAVECAAVERLDVPIAACCAYRNEPHLFIPAECKTPKPATFEVPGCTIQKIIRRRIPLDARHNAKVNYAKLQKR